MGVLVGRQAPDFTATAVKSGVFIENFKLSGLTRNVDEVLRMVDALQFYEKHGDVCPANWKPGDKAMAPNQDGLKHYFPQ